MPKRKLGDMDEAMREWAGNELGGQEVDSTEARQLVEEFHEGGVAGFAAAYNTDYGVGGTR
jgi:hypothetical protein